MRPPLDDDDVDYIDDISDLEIGLPKRRSWPLAVRLVRTVGNAETFRPRMKVLFTTGYARKPIIHQRRLDPGGQLLPKPFTAGELSAKLREILDG
jgi:hypothetical protein